MRNLFVYAIILLSLFCQEVRAETDSLYVTETKEMLDTISPSFVVESRRRLEKDTQTGLMRLDASKFKQSFVFIGSPDVIKIIQMLPGVASGTELMSGLYVHGGTGSDNLFLLDGVPLYQVSHLAGMFSSFNTEITENLDFYKSGFPARYGGRLSSVVDVTTKVGNMNEYHGTLSIGAIDGNIQIEGPIIKGRTSFNVALRRTWMDLITTPIFRLINMYSGNDFHVMSAYAFWDGNAGVDHIINDRNTLSFRFYMGRDWMEMDLFDKENKEDSESMLIDMDTDWGNILTSLKWSSRLTDSMTSKILLYHSNNSSTVTTQLGMDEYKESFKFEASDLARVNDLGLKADFDWTPIPSNRVRFGGSFQYHFFNPERYDRMISNIPELQDFTLGTTDKADYYGYEPAVYIEDEIRISDWFDVNAGFRYALFGVPGKVYHAFEPRLSLRLSFADWGSLRASYTEMNQFMHQVSTAYMDMPTNSWMPVTATRAPMCSHQLAGGIYTQFSKGITFNLEAYFKSMDNILEYTGMNVLYPPLTQWESAFSSGHGRSYGLEAELSWKTKNIDLSAYYTLSKTERLFKDIYPSWYPDRNDNRHKISLMASYKPNQKIDIYAAWNWHSGSRFTAYSHTVIHYPQLYPNYVVPEQTYHYSSPNNVRMPSYHRLDLGVNFRKKTYSGYESIWNISIYNAYCRMNPFLLIDASFNKDGVFQGTAVGIVPIIPSFSYTFRF